MNSDVDNFLLLELQKVLMKDFNDSERRVKHRLRKQSLWGELNIIGRKNTKPYFGNL